MGWGFSATRNRLVSPWDRSRRRAVRTIRARPSCARSAAVHDGGMRVQTVLVVFVLGCSSSSHPGSVGFPDASVDTSNGDIVCHVDSADAGACGTTITTCTIPDASRTHVPEGSALTYPTNPP